jgi:multimeric flavodoxin WrbA
MTQLKQQEKQHNDIKLCIDCFHCKTKNKKIYCKLGVWEEINNNGKSILHTPYDYNCPKWDEA